MAEITAAMVKELREKTGAGMLDCKKALTENDGDMEQATDYLRKKGIASAAKKSSRLASEGLINIVQQGNRASLVEVNCETDFVGKNEEFQSFVKNVSQHVLEQQPKDLQGLLQQNFAPAGKALQEATADLVARIGENISVRRFALIQAQSGEVIGTYTHMGSKIGTIIRLKGDASKLTEEILKGLAMHVAAASPRFISADEITDAEREREKAIYREQMQESGKPAEMIEKIIEGKLSKFATEVCFEDQVFVKDPEGKNSVAKYLKSLDPSAKIVEFVRFQVGEGMEKKQEDFAAEVAKQVNK